MKTSCIDYSVKQCFTLVLHELRICLEVISKARERVPKARSRLCPQGADCAAVPAGVCRASTRQTQVDVEVDTHPRPRTPSLHSVTRCDAVRRCCAGLRRGSPLPCGFAIHHAPHHTQSFVVGRAFFSLSGTTPADIPSCSVVIDSLSRPSSSRVLLWLVRDTTLAKVN